ncbi:MAG: LptF/LptG family permease [Planctomycetes bacterium]|nr:LptF/LptG family permease [Planctomycetota bacterium]
MPGLLYRYMLGELLRVFALCAAVLVMVIAFGAAIKPLAADDLIGPLQTAKYIMLAIVPMLQFALPFAAGFAATMVFHRMTSDNEILAAAAAGISYRRILLPIVALGAALVIVMVLLTQWVIPRFWGLMHHNLATGVTNVFQASIDKGLPFQIGDLQIWADRLRVQHHPQDTDAQTRLILFRVAAAELDADGRIVTDITARQGVVDIHQRGGRTYLKLTLVDTVAFMGRTGELVRTPKIEPQRAIVVPDPVRDRPMFMTQRQLLALRKRPDDFSRVNGHKIALAESIRAIEVWNYIDDQLASDGMIELAGPDRRISIHADQLVGGQFSTTDGRAVEVRQLDAAGPVRLVSARQVDLRPSVGSTLTEPSFDLDLYECEVVDLRSDGSVNYRARLTIPILTLPQQTWPDLSKLPHEQLLKRAEQMDGAVKSRARRLVEDIRILRLEIHSRLQRRYALSLTAMLLLLLGATLAMLLRNSVPLVIYIGAFVPSILDIILITGGGHMVRSGAVTTGLIVLWSGNCLLVAVLWYTLARLMRN